MANGERVSGHSHPPISRIIEIGVVCNNAQIINNTCLGQPTEGALMVLGHKVYFLVFAQDSSNFWGYSSLGASMT